MAGTLSWSGIVRLGFVQMSLGAIVVLAISTLNRVMVVELALPAVLPGALIAIHYAVQLLRPRWGYGSDSGGRATPWVVGGMAVLALGGIAAAMATALMAQNLAAGIALAALSYAMVGVGAGAAGTSLLVLLAKLSPPGRRPAAAAIVWIMMIAGFAVSAGSVSKFLDPFSMERLVRVAAIVSSAAFAVASLAIWGVETRYRAPAGAAPRGAKVSFLKALGQVWTEREARRFTIFIFISMLAFNAQELLLEPFAGSIFAFTPGDTAALTGYHQMGILSGMLLGAVSFAVAKRTGLGSPLLWTIGGCCASAFALLGLTAAGVYARASLVNPGVLCLGVANGAFAVAAVGSMMRLAGEGHAGRSGVRMGLWGAAQGIASGFGGLIGTLATDMVRQLTGSALTAYTSVFVSAAAVFFLAALLAARLSSLRVTPQAGVAAQNRSSHNRPAGVMAGKAGAR